MQDKHCGNCYDVYLIQSQYKGNHKRRGAAEGRRLCLLALNEVNVAENTTLLVLHVGNGDKNHFQGRQATRLGSGVFVIPQIVKIQPTSFP